MFYVWNVPQKGAILWRRFFFSCLPLVYMGMDLLLSAAERKKCFVALEYNLRNLYSWFTIQVHNCRIVLCNCFLWRLSIDIWCVIRATVPCPGKCELPLERRRSKEFTPNSQVTCWRCTNQVLAKSIWGATGSVPMCKINYICFSQSVQVNQTKFYLSIAPNNNFFVFIPLKVDRAVVTI